MFGPYSGEPGSPDSTVATPVRLDEGCILNTDHKPEIVHAGERGRDELNIPVAFSLKVWGKALGSHTQVFGAQ